jgi:hypothetical protein
VEQATNSKGELILATDVEAEEVELEEEEEEELEEEAVKL